MVSRMTAARIPPAMTTVPADIQTPPHPQSAGEEEKRERRERRGEKGGKEEQAEWSREERGS